MRGQPNFKKRIWDYLEEKLKKNANFEDKAENTDLHNSIIKGELKPFTKTLNKGFDLKEKLQTLEERNHEGKTAIMLAAEHNKSDIFNYILD